ncbi:MAG: A/G-specific adenine glycosylase [Alphaproteobacteria bacterium]|nr:A/G-specific adenine glycosylase [Alphaproteobacteria bacterium]
MTIDRRSMITQAVGCWYGRNVRALPWRVGPATSMTGRRQDPYLVWLSEIMLQQTTVVHAAPYFLRFAKRWPSVEALASASWEDVSAAWAGLGYYSRARNLHACAQTVAAAGDFPQDRQGLLRLPGVGPYTAAAVAAIAFGEAVAPIDGNIERVVSRLFAIGGDRTEAGWRAVRKVIAAEAQGLFDALEPSHPPGDLAQGLMDLGAMICTPRRPMCGVCPLFELCAARVEGEPDRYPVKPLTSKRPERLGSAFVALRGDSVLLTRRPPSGLLSGMLMPPTSEWTNAPRDNALDGAPHGFAWERAGEVRHVFTHFALRLEVWRGDRRDEGVFADGEGFVWMLRDVALASLPTVGRKAVVLALG